MTEPSSAAPPHRPPLTPLRWQQQGRHPAWCWRVTAVGLLQWPAAPPTGPLVVDGRGLTHFDSLLAARLWALAREAGERLRWEDCPPAWARSGPGPRGRAGPRRPRALAGWRASGCG
jgi:hypothetical protein